MTEGHIPKKAVINPKADRNGNTFAQLSIEVASGDFEGKTVQMNYLPLPKVVTEGMSKAERIKASDLGVPFQRFCRAFKITGHMPTDREAWQDWISQFYESHGKFTVRNQEYPEGSGRMRSGVSDFIF